MKETEKTDRTRGGRREQSGQEETGEGIKRMRGEDKRKDKKGGEDKRKDKKGGESVLS